MKKNLRSTVKKFFRRTNLNLKYLMAHLCDVKLGVINSGNSDDFF